MVTTIQQIEGMRAGLTHIALALGKLQTADAKAVLTEIHNALKGRGRRIKPTEWTPEKLKEELAFFSVAVTNTHQKLEQGSRNLQILAIQLGNTISVYRPSPTTNQNFESPNAEL